MPDLSLAYRRLAVASLSPFHKNPRRGNVAAIAESLSATGQYKPVVVVNEGSLTGRPLEVLAGNHTLAAAVELGWVELEAVLVDVDDEVAARIVLADNRTADLGSYDDAVLADLLGDLGDLTGTGYDDADLSRVLAGLTPPVALTDPDDVPDLPEVPVSRVGDVWVLGPHRLFVGSATDTAAVLAAAGDLAPADCVWTDPPYGVDYKGGTGLTIANDGAAEAAALWAGSIPTLVAIARPGAPLYVAHPDNGRDVFLLPLRSAGVRLRQTLIWVKDSLVLSRADYHYRMEPIFEAELPGAADDSDYVPISYGFAPGGEGRLGRGGPHWHGDNKASNVLEVPRPKRSSVHPTMKPVALIRPMLERSCRPGGVVADLFAGSGSTMLAAHAEGRRAFLVEYSPHYADVICQRWEEHTGVVPVRSGVPVTFVGGA